MTFALDANECWYIVSTEEAQELREIDYSEQVSYCFLHD